MFERVWCYGRDIIGFPLLEGAERTLGEHSEGLGLVLPRWGISDFVGAGTSFYKASPSLGQVWVRSQPDQVDTHASKHPGLSCT